MHEYIIDEKYRVLSSSSSCGSQVKFYKDGKWYKLNHTGNEAVAEYLVCTVLKCSNLHNFVDYDMCIVNRRKACVANHFLSKNESFISFSKLYKYLTGGDLTDKLNSIPEVSERFSYLVSMVKDLTRLDITLYLSNILALDMLVLNIDRHCSNLGVLYDGKEYKEAPIFDNGQSLFQNYTVFPPTNDYDINIQKACSNTISGSFEQQFLVSKPTLKIDYKLLYKKLDSIRDSKALDCLMKQLSKYRKLFDKELIQ